MTEETELTTVRQKLREAAMFIDAYLVLLDEVSESTNNRAVSAFLGCPPSNEVLSRYNNLQDQGMEWLEEQAEIFRVRTDELMMKYGELTLIKLEAMSRCTVEGCEDKETAGKLLSELNNGDDGYVQ